MAARAHRNVVLEFISIVLVVGLASTLSPRPAFA